MKLLMAIASMLLLTQLSAESMTLDSPAFRDGETIPIKYSCKGGDVSPPLHISNIPPKTQSLALIVEDPDASNRTFVHWVVWNIDPQIEQLGEHTGLGAHGQNTFGTMGYRGPCPPPDGVHHYVFKLYALDTLLNLPEGSIREQLEPAMKGHILDETELTGTFSQ